jgi:uncharacterized protein
VNPYEHLTRAGLRVGVLLDLYVPVAHGRGAHRRTAYPRQRPRYDRPLVPSDNVQIVKDGFAAMARGDLDGVLAGLHPRIVWHPSDDFPEAGPFVGFDGIRALFALIFESFEEFMLEPERFIELGDTVVVPVHQSGRGKSSGASVDNRYVLVFELSEGKSFRVTTYRELDEALAASRASDRLPAE